MNDQQEDGDLVCKGNGNENMRTTERTSAGAEETVKHVWMRSTFKAVRSQQGVEW